jgi:hypothetical protein
MNCTECQMITYRLFERSVEKGHRETWGKRHAVDSREGKRRVSSGSRPLGIRRTSLKPSEVLLSNVGAEAPTPCLFPSQFPVALPRSLFPADVHCLTGLSSGSGGVGWQDGLDGPFTGLACAGVQSREKNHLPALSLLLRARHAVQVAASLGPSEKLARRSIALDEACVATVPRTIVLKRLKRQPK